MCFRNILWMIPALQRLVHCVPLAVVEDVLLRLPPGRSPDHLPGCACLVARAFGGPRRCAREPRLACLKAAPDDPRGLQTTSSLRALAVVEDVLTGCLGGILGSIYPGYDGHSHRGSRGHRDAAAVCLWWPSSFVCRPPLGHLRDRRRGCDASVTLLILRRQELLTGHLRDRLPERLRDHLPITFAISFANTSTIISPITSRSSSRVYQPHSPRISGHALAFYPAASLCEW